MGVLGLCPMASLSLQSGSDEFFPLKSLSEARWNCPPLCEGHVGLGLSPSPSPIASESLMAGRYLRTVRC